MKIWVVSAAVDGKGTMATDSLWNDKDLADKAASDLMQMGDYAVVSLPYILNESWKDRVARDLNNLVDKQKGIV